MTSLDTNVVLRFLLDDIPEQTKKATKLISQESVYVTDVVVVEIIYVLEKVIELSRHDIAKLVTDFLNFEGVAHNTFFLIEVIHQYEQHPALSIVDCYAETEAKTYHNSLVSFDKKLVKQGGGHVRAL